MLLLVHSHDKQTVPQCLEFFMSIRQTLERGLVKFEKANSRVSVHVHGSLIPTLLSLWNLIFVHDAAVCGLSRVRLCQPCHREEGERKPSGPPLHHVLHDRLPGQIFGTATREPTQPSVHRAGHDEELLICHTKGGSGNNPLGEFEYAEPLQLVHLQEGPRNMLRRKLPVSDPPTPTCC